MANTPIQIKRSLTSNTPETLNIGEPAYSYSSNTLFIGSPAETGAIAIGGHDSYLRGITSYEHANSAFNRANAASVRANNSLNANVGGLITGDVVIQGNLNIVGGSIGANVPVVLIGDNIITLNTSISQSGQPTMNAGIEIDRGAQPNVYLLWNETLDRWQFTNDGTNYDDLGGSATASYANSAFIKANASFDHANAAFAAANNVFPQVQPAYDTANAAFIHANSGFIQTNASFAHANAAYQSQNATGQYTNSAFILANSNFAHANSGFDHANSAFIKANSAYESQNATGQYANAAFTLANGAFIHANSGFIQANAAYQSQNATGNVANAAFANANGAFAAANAAFANANGAFAAANASFNTGNSAFIQANSGFIQANAAYQSQNATGNVANAAFANANGAFAAANAAFANANGAFARANAAFANANGAFAAANVSFNTANAAFIRANNSLNANAGGQVTGDVVIVGNVTSNTLTTTGSNGSITGANAIFTNYIFAANGNVDLYIYSSLAYANANAALARANASFANANGAFAAANAAFANANGAFAAANAAYIHANSGFIQANAAYQSQNATGQYANAAFNHANSGFIQANASFDFANAAYLSQNATGQYANAAFANANGAFAAANAAYIQANSAFIQTNAAFGHANAAYISQNATGQYANAAFIHANSGFIQANAAYATANVKTQTFVQATSPVSANVDDIWIDSSSGIQYVYVNSNTANQWVEFGPYSSPLNGTANIQFADQTIFTVKAAQPLVLLSSGSDIHLNAAANVVTLNIVPSNPTISLGSSDRPFKNVWISNASIHLAGNGLLSGQPVKITNDANNVVIDTGGLKIQGGALQANSFLGVSHLYALNVESSFVVSNATFSSTNALMKIIGSNTGFSRTPINPGYMLHITGKQNTASRIINDSFGADANTYPLYAGRAARGTPESPTAVKAGDILARYTGNGYDGTNYAAFGTGRIDIIATEDHTSSNKGTSIILSTMANNTNTLSNIANFDGNTSTIYGTLLVTKGYLQYARAANVANTAALTIDFANDSIIRCTVNSAMTVTFTNYLAGKSVELWVTNVTNISRSITHGVAASNSTNGATTKSIPLNSVAVFKYVSWGGDLANTQVAIHQG